MWAASWENQRSAYAKTKTQISFAVTAKLISAFVFASWIVQYLYFLNTQFQASSHLQWLYSLVCVRPGQNPHCWFYLVAAHVILLNMSKDFIPFSHCLVCYVFVTQEEICFLAIFFWKKKKCNGIVFEDNLDASFFNADEKIEEINSKFESCHQAWLLHCKGKELIVPVLQVS